MNTYKEQKQALAGWIKGLPGALPFTLYSSAELLKVFDPEGMNEAKKLLTGPIVWCDSAYKAMEGADVLVIVTEWNEFRALDFAKIKALLKTPLMIDLRNIYRPAQMAEHGFNYISVGRAEARPAG